MKVSVRVPATSANLGPGFDCFGLALPIYNTITIEETVLGEDKDSFKADDTVTRAGHDYVYSDISFEEISSETIPMYKYLDTEVLQGVLIVENYPETLPYDYEGKMYDLKYSDYEVS